MRIHPIIFGILIISVFFGVIWTFQAAGFWSTSGKVNAGGEAVQPDATNPDSIKGWMTLEQISSVYQVPMSELLATIGLPADTPPSTPIKDLESDSFETSTLRTWLQNRIDQKSSSSSAMQATVTPTIQKEIPLENTAIPETTTDQTTHGLPAQTITGKTTIQEVLDWGISPETLKIILDGELPPPTTVIKDYMSQKGLEFSSIKTRLQAELDKP